MSKTTGALIIIGLVAAQACSPAANPQLVPGRPPPAEPAPAPERGASPAPTPAPAPPPAPTPAKDGPNISRSAGEENGVVVFWPRTIPRSDDPIITELAHAIQKRLVAIVKKALPSAKIDARPMPERVCPSYGCKAATIGVLLAHGGGGCTVVGLVSKAGKAPAKLVPWGGVVKLKMPEVPFREHPERQVTIRDAVPCGKLLESLGAGEQALVDALGSTG